MKIIDLSIDSTALTSLLTAAKQENIILRTADGLEFILAEINNFDREIELTRQNQELMAFLNERGQQTKTLSAAEVRARLGLISGE
jgi:phosphoserine phosphatase